ncbi:MAG: hypothetical protein KGK07_08515 [Chloroflexota bacterium]|nr:hypothetical protein [Chloroflexota bacterium]
MKSPTFVRLAVLAAVLLGVAAGAVTGLLFITRSTTAQSAVSVLQEARAAQTAALAALGSNTTLHVMGVEYRSPAPLNLPGTTISESFWTFDAAGKLSAYSSVTKGTDGHVYQHAELVGGAMVHTDVASGQTSTTPGWGAYTFDGLRARYNQVVTDLLARVGSSATAQTTTFNGVAAYAIEMPGGGGRTNRSYISQNDHSILGSETLAPDGHVTAYTRTAVMEVLSNGPAIATGAPSLVNGKVSVPIMTTGAITNPYSGINVHLRWNPAVFSFRSANASGSVLGSPVCPSAVDSDGGGVVVGCASTGGASTSVSGLVLTVILMPKTGCSALHLYTHAGTDGGDAKTGSYTINAADTHPQFNQYVGGTANVSGQRC